MVAAAGVVAEAGDVGTAVVDTASAAAGNPQRRVGRWRRQRDEVGLLDEVSERPVYEAEGPWEKRQGRHDP